MRRSASSAMPASAARMRSSTTVPSKGSYIVTHEPWSMLTPPGYAGSASQEVRAPVFRELRSEAGGIGLGEAPVGLVAAGLPPDRVVGAPTGGPQRLLVDLVVGGQRHLLDDPHESRSPLRAEVALL